MICPYCGSTNLQKRGTNESGTRHRYRCNACHRWPTQDTGKVERTSPAKILLMDIETLPMEVYVFDLAHNDYINPNNIIKDWCVLTWSAKWLFNDTVSYGALSPEEAIDRNDKRILQPIWDLFDQADIVIGHNSVRFDHKKLNTRFLVNGLHRPMYYRTIDTLQVAKANFAFSSNKLDYINAQLGIHQKTGTGMGLWKRCANGDPMAIQEMLQYNMNDVQILEELYVKLLPWIGKHPSMKTYVSIANDVCPNCGNTDLSWGGFYRTNANKYRAFRCDKCGSIGRSSKKSRS